MADVTISSLPLGTPSGNALLPFSNGSSTSSVPVSAIFHYAGNIGIGVASPTVKLDVDGVALANYFTLKSNTASAPNVDAAITRPADGNLALITNTTERLRIDSIGNVGIGTTSPVAKLQTFGSSLGTALNDTTEIARFSNSNGNINHLSIRQNRYVAGSSWGSAETRIQQITDITNQGYISFNPDAAGGVAIGSGTPSSERLRINSSGNVGIGTTTPTAKLHVAGDVRATNTPKAWCSFTGRTTNGICTINKQYNVASVNRNSVGNYTVTFTNQLDGTHHMVIGTGNAVSNVSYDSPIFNSGDITTSTSFSVSIVNGSNVGIYDPVNGAGIVVYG